jgi:chromosome segregation ATPase
MSFRIAPSCKTIKLSPSQKKTYLSLKSSLQKVFSTQYHSKLQQNHDFVQIFSPSSSKATSPRPSHTPSIELQHTPVKLLKTLSPAFQRVKSSDISSDTFGRLSYSNSSLDGRQETEGVLRVQSRNTNKEDYKSEIESCRKEILRMKSKLTKMENLNGKKTPIRQSQDSEVVLKLKKQRETLAKRHRAEMEQQRVDMKKSLQQEIDKLHESFLVRLSMEQKSIVEKKEKELKEYYAGEIALIEKEHEARLKLKISQIKAEFERQAKRTQEENLAIKKQNDVLRQQIEDANSRIEIMKAAKSNEKSVFGNRGNLESELEEMNDKYNQLQRDYIELKRKKSSGALCEKCKAFTKADEMLSHKLASIRQFLNKPN